MRGTTESEFSRGANEERTPWVPLDAIKGLPSFAKSMLLPLARIVGGKRCLSRETASQVINLIDGAEDNPSSNPHPTNPGGRRHWSNPGRGGNPRGPGRYQRKEDYR